MTPVSVHVFWSESSLFPDEDRDYQFQEFEDIARKAARLRDEGAGYDKTKIRVEFDTGDTFVCRLDLAEHDEHNFQSYVRRYLAWAQEAEPSDSLGITALLRSITWTTSEQED